VTRIQYSAKETPGGLLVVYEDDGVGIDPQYRSLLFQKGAGKKAGLGLFLAREILSITGITLRETGRPGRGVRFEMLVQRDHYRIIQRRF
jgi:signal transduction histidine kinase